MIKFRSAKWRNFLSTGSQFTEVYLDKSPTTLIVGENGAGKSTILDAICFALFSKPFRNINKPQLVNSINQKQAEVHVEFTIGTKNYRIVRSIKPNTFEIYLNDVLLNQDAAARDYQKYLEEHVLKLNYKSFTQIVILGSASFTPFMQLNAATRREVIEDLLDIKIFSTMNDVLKSKQSGIKVQIADIESKVEIGKAKAKIQQEYIEKLKADKQKKNDDTVLLIEQARTRIASYQEEIDKLKKQSTELKNTIIDDTDQVSKDKKLKSLKEKLKDKVASIQKEIDFYNTHDECPTCGQHLDEEFKNNTTYEHGSKLKELEEACTKIHADIETVETRLEEIQVVKESIADISDAIIEKSSEVHAEQNYINKLEKDIKESDDTVTDVEVEKKKLKELAQQVVGLAEDKAKLVEERHYLDVAGILLKDTGIKTKVIKQYLPVINKLVNKYLQAMDFFVTFELDEAFNETIKSRHRDEFSYASFSEGEKAKIDLALLFAWRSIARMKNSANTNLLMLDEVFDGSLDINGTDYVMTILNTLGDESNIFIISHKDALFDKFRSVIRFEKHQNFSRIAK